MGLCKPHEVQQDQVQGPACELGQSQAQKKAETVGAVQPGEEKAPGRPYGSLPVPEGAYKKEGEGLFTRACSTRTRGNGFKLKKDRFRLDIRKKFFIMRVLRHWNRLHREAVAVPTLKVLKARLDGALSSLV